MKINYGEFNLEANGGKELLLLGFGLTLLSGLSYGMMRVLHTIAQREDLPALIEKTPNVARLSEYTQKRLG